MTNPFTPSTIHPPVTPDYDPRAYGSVGADIPRGHRDFIMSRSELMRFAVNPWRWVRRESEKSTEAMQWGSLVDVLTLTPQLFSRNYEIVPDTYDAPGMLCPKCGSVTDSKTCSKCKVERVKTAIATPWNWNADICAQWRAKVEGGGRLPVKRDVLEEARIASARLLEDARIARLLQCSQKQVLIHVEYRDKDTGLTVQIKTLPDIVPDASNKEFGCFLADLKTTNDARPEKWERRVWDDGYAVQAAMFLDASSAATGTQRDSFYHIVQEQDPPYAIGRRMLSTEFVELGRDVYSRQLKRYCRCLATGVFPGYDDEDLPGSFVYDGWRASEPASWMIA